MDTTIQTKLTKTEWINIEKPVGPDELRILQIILDGYNNPQIRYNINQSFIQSLRFETTPEKIQEFDIYFYQEYFSKEIDGLYNTQFSGVTNSKKEKKGATETKHGEHEIIQKIIQWKTEISTSLGGGSGNKTPKIKKADLIRIQKLEKEIHNKKKQIFEFTLLEIVKRWVTECVGVGGGDKINTGCSLYTLIQLRKSHIPNINSFVLSFVDYMIKWGEEKISIKDALHNSPQFIEKNPDILKYQDITLFSHQKQLFSVFSNTLSLSKNNISGDNNDKTAPPQQTTRPGSKLVLYTAPTGTGKTLSPIGLSQHYKIIFVCVARHVGLALAKSAVSVGKKVAFAFGCETANDIRLHYFSAVDYTINKKTGGIGKIDNSIGTNVEIMICDVKSYITAMYYMLAFNPNERLITYWDEPTITMDYENHPLHETIHRNWTDNQISNVVLSCATLPKEEEIRETITDFQTRFNDAQIYNISSYDCKKSITLLNKEGFSVLPHLLFPDYLNTIKSVLYCMENKTLLRYFNLEEVVRCIEYIMPFMPINYQPDSYFESISQITMDTIKTYYLFLLKRVDATQWPDIHSYLTNTLQPKYGGNEPNVAVTAAAAAAEPFRKTKSIDVSVSVSVSVSRRNIHETGNNFHRSFSTGVTDNVAATTTATKHFQGVLLTTEDAHTLTDGPTIYIVGDTDKLSAFYVQQTKIPDKIIQDIMEKMGVNEILQHKISLLEKMMEDVIGKDADKEKKMEKMASIDGGTTSSGGGGGQKREISKLMNELEILQNQIKIIHMDMKYIPNTKPHQIIWNGGKITEHAYAPFVDETAVKQIMVTGVSNQMKMLLLLGIGVFSSQQTADSQYMEIMKQMATEQKLYMIIADTDYIYGSNYQFCHAFIGKDLTKTMTPQKTIQAMGRVGRGKIQQDYTVRFRDNSLLEKLFMPIQPDENKEAINMNRLFSS